MIHKLHRISALIIGTYVLFHIANHLMALYSASLHIEFMEGYRKIYQYPPLETLLFTCVAYQVISGIYFLKLRWGQRSGFFEKVQAVSGVYLSIFLIVHTTSNLFGRSGLIMDNNFNYAASGMYIPQYHFSFFLFFFLAVVAIFTHIGSAIHWLSREHLSIKARNNVSTVFIFTGIMLGGLVILSFYWSFY